MGKLLVARLGHITLWRVMLGASLLLTNVFIALLLLSRGAPLWQVYGFYLIYAVVAAASTYPCCRIVNRFGTRVGFLMACIGRAVQALLLTALTAGAPIWTATLLAVAFAVSGVFSACSQHLHVSRLITDEHKGRDLSRVENVVQTVTDLAPLIGGTLAYARGEVWLGVLAATLALLAVVPIWRSHPRTSNHEPEPRVHFRHHAPWGHLAASFSWNWQTGAGDWAWSIYIAAVLPSFWMVGAISSFAAILTAWITSIVLIEAIGHLIDKRRRGLRLVLLYTVFVSSCVHLIRVIVVAMSGFFVTAPLITIGILAISTMSYNLVLKTGLIAWQASYYTHLKPAGINYTASMQFVGCCSHIVLWGGLCLLAYTGQTGGALFGAASVTSALLVWGCLFIRPQIKPTDSSAGAALASR